MTRLRLLPAAMVLALVTSIAHADDQDVIDYRVHIMKTMSEEVAAINLILQHKAPAESFSTHVKVLAVTAATAKKAFEADIAGVHAKPEIWTKWADFSKRLDELQASTADLAKVAEAGGVEAAGPKVQTALTCKSCHDVYRVPRK
jgi:cytochrome c556